MAAETRQVTAKTRIYLPGGSHGFRPGDTLPLPVAVADALVAAGHLDAAPQATPAPTGGPAADAASEPSGEAAAPAA